MVVYVCYMIDLTMHMDPAFRVVSILDAASLNFFVKCKTLKFIAGTINVQGEVSMVMDFIFFEPIKNG